MRDNAEWDRRECDKLPVLAGEAQCRSPIKEEVVPRVHPVPTYEAEDTSLTQDARHTATHAVQVHISAWN